MLINFLKLCITFANRPPKLNIRQVLGPFRDYILLLSNGFGLF